MFVCFVLTNPTFNLSMVSHFDLCRVSFLHLYGDLTSPLLVCIHKEGPLYYNNDDSCSCMSRPVILEISLIIVELLTIIVILSCDLCEVVTSLCFGGLWLCSAQVSEVVSLSSYLFDGVSSSSNYFMFKFRYNTLCIYM